MPAILERVNIVQYKYYDPPLNFFNIDEELETRATRKEILDLIQQASESGEEVLARIDYELHFGCVNILNVNAFEAECISDGQLALMHGGPVAVYQECMRRNMTVNQLWGSKEQEETLEQHYKMPYEDCIAQLKEWRANWL